MVEQVAETCERCDGLPGDIVKCSCGTKFCENCFLTVHLERNPEHRRGGTSETEQAWSWISGTAATQADNILRAVHFEQDEAAKWFGLHVQKITEGDRVARLIDTGRFSHLVEDSMHHSKNSPRRQFPSITSFIGETGAGKSTLVRSLIYLAANPRMIENLEAPVSDARTSATTCLPTTGEVNLYRDPETFGTKFPLFFADCEGLCGGEPVATRYQTQWHKHHRRYLVQPKDGSQTDRRTAVMIIYPRFLYMFSDVICMVTRNPKAYADSVVKLLEWSRVGAHNTINQYALPALVIVLNGPPVEKDAWISDDHEATTRDFLTAIEKEANDNAILREMANKHGDKTMKGLLMRNFSSVYVHYIPLEGFQSLGNSGIIIPQMARLARRIRSDAESVQKMRAETWSLFDATQLKILFKLAFEHLASGSEDPFDFSQCQRQISPSATVEGHFAEFLHRCMQSRNNKNFAATASIMGSCIVRNSMKLKGSYLLRPSVVFDEGLKEVCHRALDQFLSHCQPCSYIHPERRLRCINTKNGHAKGHQAADGGFLADGNFMAEAFNVDRFFKLIDDSVTEILRSMDKDVDSNRDARRLYVAERHRELLRALPDQTFWADPCGARQPDQSNNPPALPLGWHPNTRTSVCYACLFGRPEYTLPCGHVICSDCVREFDQATGDERYPGTAVHKCCVLCGSRENKVGTWPHTMGYRPDLSGIRLLSLDGGGVRGIIQLSILSRLELLVNLEIPFGELFDLIVGTSAGGVIALGLGIHNLSVRDCIAHFKELCENGFKNAPGSKSQWYGWLVRLFITSIYKTGPLEAAMKNAFGEENLFGHRGNASRVAVTTTVNNKGCLLANYHWGDGGRYLNSNISTWRTARCTSAAPMYFEPVFHDGSECWDGGLVSNNPIQIALDEMKAIWGQNATPDVVISLGCGEAKNHQRQPSQLLILPNRLAQLFQTLLETMNGNAAWERFKDSADRDLLDRCSRLNVHLQQWPCEPGLDDVKTVPEMESLAGGSEFQYQRPTGDYPPAWGPGASDELEVLAYRLMGSLFFFELESIKQDEEVSIAKGWICCRLNPDRECYGQLIKRTSYFMAGARKVSVSARQGKERFRLDVSLQKQDSLDSEPLRIDVNFGCPYDVSISGFPVTLQRLKSHWEKR